MVTLHTPGPPDTQREHKLLVKKSAPNFDEGETLKCRIMKIDNHVFDSVESLHEHFDEL